MFIIFWKIKYQTNEYLPYLEKCWNEVVLDTLLVHIFPFSCKTWIEHCKPVHMSHRKQLVSEMLLFCGQRDQHWLWIWWNHMECKRAVFKAWMLYVTKF